MCDFLSALVFSDGKIFSDPEHTDSHSDLILVKGLDDSRPLETRGWIRVEFKPDHDDTLDQPETYKLKVDETSTPAWFDDAMRFDITERLREQVEKMIVRDSREILLGGCWILARGAKVASVKNGRVRAMFDSQATLWGNSHATLFDNSHATLFDNSHATLFDNSQATLRENSHATLYGNSQAALRGNSQATLRENSHATLYGNSQAALRGNSQATLRGNSQATLFGNGAKLIDERIK
jgi:phage gp45-like